MKKYGMWLLWIVALAALLSAVQARLQDTAEPENACTTYIYWESPLLK